MNYVERHFGDWARDTAHLTMLEDGAYNRLCDLYYVRETPLPAELVACCRLVRAVSKQEREAVKAVLEEFFQLGSDGWQHKRCDAEIERFRTKSGKASASAKARWNKDAPQSEGNANAYANASPDVMRTHSEGNATRGRGRARTHSPSTNTQVRSKATTGGGASRSTPPERPEGVDPQVWSDWLQLRKAKKAPVTATVLATATEEAAKAGLTLGQFLRVWCMRGSQGLQADWIKPDELRQFRPAAPTAAERATAAKAARFDEMTGGRFSPAKPTPGGEIIDMETNDGAPRLVA